MNRQTIIVGTTQTKAFLLLLFAFIFGTQAFSQLPCGYKYSRLIRIDHTKVMGAADLQSFPVYLTTLGLGDQALLKSVLNGGHVQSAMGFDIAFTAADGVTPLSFQMENYAPLTGEYEAWINIPYLSHTADTYFYMYYGNAAILGNQSSTATWDASTVGVWHLDNGVYADVTANAQTTTTSGAIANDPAAKILSGVKFNGGASPTPNQHVQVGLTGGTSNSGTVELWGKVTTYESSTYFFGETLDQVGQGYSDRIQLWQADGAGTLELGMGATHSQAAVMTLSLNTWYHIAATWSTSGGGNGTYFVYVNGVQKATGSYTGFAGLYTSADVGDDGNASQETESLTGSTDEVHFAKVARTGGWIGTAYNDENSPATFCLIGAEPETWTGTTNTNWNTATNWSGGVVPTGGANVIIANSLLNQPTLNVSEQVGYIWVQSGATLTIPAGNTLTVNYSTINCGTVTSVATGTLLYNATLATSPINQYISGTGTYTQGLLTANPSTLTDTVFLNTSTVTVSSNFLISQGVFDCLTNAYSVAGNFTDNSVFLPVTGTVTLNGSAGTQTLASTEAAGLTFYNLILKNTSATAPAITTSANTNINNQLTFNAANTGLVNLNAKTMTLGTAAATPGTLTYPATTSGWLYGGTFKRWFNTPAVAIPNNTGLFPVGSDGVQNVYQPLWFGSSLALTTGGTVSVNHTPTGSWHTNVAFTDLSWTPPVTGNPIQGISVAAWVVTTGNGLALSGSNGQIRFGGNGFNIFVLTDVDACQAAGAVGTFSASTNTVVPLEVNRTGLSLANVNNTWYIGTNNLVASPLPIQLLSFSATCQDNYPYIQWATATETNNNYFTIDKTEDGSHYETVGTIKGAGNSLTERSYSTLDYNNPSEVTYYRLSQTDLDGTVTHVKSVAFDPCENAETINGYSSNNVINVAITSPIAATYEVMVKNTLGQTVLSETESAETGLNTYKLFPQASAGVYILQVIGNNKVYTKKVLLMSTK